MFLKALFFSFKALHKYLKNYFSKRANICSSGHTLNTNCCLLSSFLYSRSNMKATVFLTLTCLVCYTAQQSYHFSNGWNPGKRAVMQNTCTFSPYVKSMVYKLISVSRIIVYLICIFFSW